jgi:hypothetical protein
MEEMKVKEYGWLALYTYTKLSHETSYNLSLAGKEGGWGADWWG